MLNLILATAGGGKTTYIMNLIKQFSGDGEKQITLVVPEQFSFMSEKQMLADAGARAMADIDVESFTSLGERLVGKPGLHERRRLSDAARAALMKRALESVSDKLNLYGNHVSRKSVITEFTALSSVFKQNSLSTDSVRLALANAPDGLLKMKLTDIITVLDAYDAMVGDSYFNPDDLLDELCEILPGNDYFSNRIVFIDAFRGFTTQEYKVIGHMLAKAQAVYVTLCTDNLENSGDETDLFAHTKRMAHRLINIARRAGVSVAEPQYLSMPDNTSPSFSRFASPELAALERELFSPESNVYDDECGGITLCTAPDIYAECRFVACTAKKLIRENGYRCRDIAVIARNSEPYEIPLRSALKKCGISVFEDSRQPVDASPVVNLVACALRIASEGFTTETLMRYLKTGLAGLETKEIADLENYCYLWKISGSAWLDDWNQSPHGFGAVNNSEDEAELEYLNALRCRAVDPLRRLRDKLRDATGDEAAKAVFKFTKSINLRDNIRTLASGFIADSQAGLAIELERMWSVVVDLLDSMEALMRERHITASEFYDMFDLMLSVQTVGSLPQGLDEITIGSADRIRTNSPKIVFIVGANNGSFPAIPSYGSTLTDKDRRRMSEMGIELSGFGEYKLAEEKLIAYSAFCCASDKLYVCRPEKNEKGEQLSASELFIKIETLFPKCRRVNSAELSGLYYIESKESAFEQLAENKSKQNEIYATLSEYFSGDSQFAGRLAALERASGGRNFEIQNPKNAEALFGRDMYISASRVESFYQCPFSYFCRYGIKAMPRMQAELDPMQRGNVIHYALEQLLMKYDKESLLAASADELNSYISAIMNDYMMTRLDGANRSRRFVYLFNKLIMTVCDIAQRLISELKVSSFVPVDFELKIGNNGEVPAYEIGINSGKIVISGSVDRVDKATINGKEYVRVVDYKSSDKAFSLSDVMQGLNMQMLIYLFAIWQNGGTKYEQALPAGVLYYTANSPIIPAERSATPEEIDKARKKKSKMNGIVLNDPDVIIAMDEESSGLFVPATLSKGAVKGSVIGLQQLGKLKDKADELLKSMANELHAGKIHALPAHGKNYKNTCSYCDYKAVCSYEDGIPVREVEDINADGVIKELEGVKNDEVDR